MTTKCFHRRTVLSLCLALLAGATGVSAQNIFVKLITPSGSASSLSTVHIAAPAGAGNYSAAAPVSGTNWNAVTVFSEPSATVAGTYNIFSSSSLVDPVTGSTITPTYTVYLVQTATSNHGNPASASGENTIQPGGVMQNAIKNFNYGANIVSNIISSLPVSKPYKLYIYGGTTTTNQGAAINLPNSGNWVSGQPTNLITWNTNLNSYGSFGSIWTTNNGTTNLMPQLSFPTTTGTLTNGGAWGVLNVQSDSSGNLNFVLDGANVPGGTSANTTIYWNGFQVVRVPIAETVTGGGSACTNTGGVTVGLGGAESDVSYQLYITTNSVTSAVGSPVTGNSSAFNFPNVTNTGTYTVVGTLTGGSTANMTGSPTVTINPVTTVNTPTVSPSQTVTAGATATISVTTGGTTPTGYAWTANGGATLTNGLQASGSTIFGATTASLIISNAQAGDSASAPGYVCTVVGGCTSPSSAAATLTVSTANTAPAITGLTNQTVLAGSNATLAPSVLGIPTPVRQWYYSSNGGTSSNAITGATNSSLTLTNVQYSQNGYIYYLYATNSVGVLTSNMTLSVTQIAPTITGLTNQSVAAGFNATLSATASGAPAPTLQWLANGTPITSATNSSLTVTNLRASQSGSIYSLVAANTAGTVTNSMTLTVTNLQLTFNLDINNSGHTYAGTAVAPDTGTNWNSFVPSGTSVTMTNVVNSSGAATPSSITIGKVSGGGFNSWDNSSSAAGNPNPLTLMRDYLFGGPYLVTISNLTQGAYTLYAFAHGDATGQASTITINATNGGASASTTDTGNFRDLFQTNNVSLGTTNAAGNSYVALNGTVGSSGTFSFTTTYLNGFQLKFAWVAGVTGLTNQTVIAGTTATLSPTITGTAPLSYQWLSNSVALPVETNATLVLNNVQYAQNGTVYSLVASNVAGADSNSMTLTVIVTPAITGLNNQAVTVNSNTVISATVSGVPTPTLQWQFNGTNLTDGLKADGSTISGSTTSSLGIVNAQYDEAGIYYLIASNSAGVTTNSMTLTVSSGTLAPTVTGLTNLTIIAGNNGTLYAMVVGIPAPVLQWYVSTDGGATSNTIAGGTNLSLTLTNVQYSQNNYIYTLVATNVAGAASDSMTLTVTQIAPTISGLTNQTVYSGNNATFSATVGGAPAPALQWLVNGTPITSATNSTLVVTNVHGSQNGYVYSLVATNTAGTLTSNATLTVTSQLFCLNFDLNRNIYNNGTAAAPDTGTNWNQLLYTGVSGSYTLSSVTDSRDNLTSNSLTVAGNFTSFSDSTTGNPNPVNLMADYYFVGPLSLTFSNLAQGVYALYDYAHGNALAQNSVVTVGAGNGGGSASTTANATYTSNFRDTTQGPGVAYVVLNGTVGSSGTFTFTNASYLNALQLQLVSPAGVSGLTNQTVVAGTTPVLGGATVIGTTPLYYQWNSNSVPVLGGTNATLALNNVQYAQNGAVYSLVVSNAAGSDTNSMTLTVLVTPSVSITPSTQGVTVNSNIVISATVGGVPTPTLQWQFNGTNLIDGAQSDGSTISGSTTSSLGIVSAQYDEAGTYSLIASNSVGVTTNSMTLTVAASNVAPAITGLTNQTVASGSNATLSATVTGVPVPVLQWYYSPDGGATSNAIAGATSVSLTLTNVTYAQNNYIYTLVATNVVGAASASMTLTVTPIAPAISGLTNQTVVTGFNATLSPTVSGDPYPALQWLANGTPIAGATGSTLTLTNVQMAQSGNVYSLVATNVGGALTNSMTLTVTPPASIFVELLNGATALGTATINPPAGNSYSAAAPVSGTTWNTVGRSTTIPGGTTNGTYPLYSGLSLVDLASNSIAPTLSVSYVVPSGTTLTAEPASVNGENTIQPGGVMQNAWRNYDNGAGKYFVFTISNLPPSTPFGLYFEGSVNASNYGCGLQLAAGNVLGSYPTNALTVNTNLNSNGSYGSLWTVSGGTTNLVPQGTTWNVLSGQSDTNGNFAFKFNGLGNGAYLNGFQLLPPSAPQIAGLANQTNTAASNVVINATVTGVPASVLQWQFNGTNLTDGLDANGSTLSGSASSSLSISNAQIADTGIYSLIASNSVGLVTNSMTLTITNASAPVSSDASLSFLELSPAGTLTPAFSSGTTNYTAGEANANSQVTVTVTNTSAFATNVLFLNGVAQATNAGSLLVASLPLVVGSANALQVQVTAQDGLSVSNYYVTVTRAASSNAGLLSLALTPAGTLYPTFATGTLSYTATNTCANNPLTVTVTNADVTAANTLIYNGTTNGLASGATSAPLTLSPGANTVTVRVVSQDLTVTNDYVVAATLTAPPVVTVNSTNIYAGGSATLTASTSASSPTYSWSPGGATTASITVSPTTNTTYTVTVTDTATGCVGGGSGTVTILPSTNAFLASLSLTPAGTLFPTFASGTMSYNATNTFANKTVVVAAGSVNANATLALNFNGGGYGSAVTNSLSLGGNTLVLPTNTVALRVVSQDLSQTNVYTVNVLLQPSATVPKLTNSVSGSTLTLTWPADHLGYRLLVQTNNLNKGVSGNINDWGTVPGSTVITTTNITIIKTGVTNVYYKLVYP